MPRPKIAENEQLRHLIRVRVNDAVFQRLTTLQKQTDCRSICEMARKILSKEQIKFFHKDVSLNGPMEELALIRKEIKASIYLMDLLGIILFSICDFKEAIINFNFSLSVRNAHQTLNK